MKRISYLACCLLASAAFTACNDDYTDWADPQSNPQEESALASSVTLAPTASVNLSTTEADSVTIAAVTSITEGVTLNACNVALTVDGQTLTVPATVNGGSVMVKALDLNRMVVNLYKSQQSVAREVMLTLAPSVITSDGEAAVIGTQNGSAMITPVVTPAADTEYYIVGDLNSWGMDKATALKLEADATNPYLFSVIVEEAKDFTFKIVPGSAVTAPDAWQQALGAAKVIETPDSGLLAFRNEEEGDPDNLTCPGGKKMKISINVEDYTYTIKEYSDLPEAMYIIGSPNGWDWAQAFTMVPVTQTFGMFWSMQYFAAGDQIKFNSAKDWNGGEFGFSTDIVPQASIDLAGLSDAGGNINIGNAGWYLVVVTITNTDRIVEFHSPDVYLLGGLVGGSWNCDETTRFTVPADKEGDFVSPAATTAGAARICVNAVSAGDWWKSEFTLDLANGSDGSIVYRENKPVGDNLGELGYQCDVAAGQKVYVNFTTGKGRVE